MNVVLVLGGVGLVVLLAAKVLMTAKAFQVSRFWGWIVALVPFSEPVFAMQRWDRTRLPFFMGLVALCLLSASFFGVMTNEDVYQKVKSLAFSAEGVASSSEGAPVRSGAGEPTTATGLVGMSLKDVEKLYGHAQGTMNHGGVKVYVYPDFTLESADGRTVSRYQQF